MRSQFQQYLWALALAKLLPINAISLDLTDPQSVKVAARTITQDLLEYYQGNQTGQPIGVFGQSSPWWESGAVWGSLIDYWNYTADSQYNGLVQDALLAQIGPYDDFMPPNQTKSEGNDDQATWGLAAMTAAEQQFPASSASSSWLDIAINVFNSQVARWDTATCGGGLRWQIFTFNNGYDYKNAASSGLFFQLAARLARYTGNQTYADWAEKSYDWTISTGLISNEFRVYDGAHTESNCTDINRLQWTYTAASFLYGSATMYNLTNDPGNWKDRVQGLLSGMSVFFGNSTSRSSDASQGILTEVACEPQGTCAGEEYAYKGLAAQWLGATTQVAPFTSASISPLLQSSAKGAANQCSGGKNGTACGSQWSKVSYDGKTGLEQELSALNVILSTLAANASAPTTSTSTASGSQSSSTNSTVLGSQSSSTNGTVSSTGSSSPPSTSTPSQSAAKSSDASLRHAACSTVGLLALVFTAALLL